MPARREYCAAIGREHEWTGTTPVYAMLVLKNVRHAGRGFALSDISLAIAAGKPTALVGLSAPEREALARLVSGADRPQAGEVRLGGEDISNARRSRGRVLRVGPSGLAASGQKVGRLAGAEVAALAGLSAQRDAKVASLSAAQRMTLAIAQAVAARPALLIVDAPTAQLSPEAGDDLLLALPGLLAPATGVVLLLAASAGEALALSGDLAVFAGGRLIQSGPAGEVTTHPVNLASATATSWPQLNTLAMMARDGHWLLADGSRLQLPESVALPAEGPCMLAFHPEDVTLERASAGCLRFVVRAVGPVRGGYLSATFAGAAWMFPLTGAAPHEGALLNAFVDRSRLMMFDAAGKALS
jgi:glycerol transport system ATP-binding protein